MGECGQPAAVAAGPICEEEKNLQWRQREISVASSVNGNLEPSWGSRRSEMQQCCQQPNYSIAQTIHGETASSSTAFAGKSFIPSRAKLNQ